MTHSELLVDAQKPSKYFVDYTSSGDARMGSLSVEVLEMQDVIKCDLLGKSDPYAVFVFEDKVMKTDFISSCLNPVFPHKCKRAVRFPITTPASSLYIGCFDYDSDVTQTIEDDDPLGRVVIKLSSLRPNTEYDVVFPLQHSELKKLKGERGYIRLRMKLNWEGNDRKVLTSYLKPQEPMILATNDRKLWTSSLYCIHGKHIGDEYNWKVFMSYVGELKGVAFLLEKPLIKFVMDTVFWRRPIRSTFLFLSWQYLVVRPTYIPSFFVFSILATAYDTYITNASRRPKLHRVTPIYDILFTLIGGGIFWKFRGIDAPTETNDHPYINFDDKLASMNMNPSSKDDETDDLDVSDLMGPKASPAEGSPPNSKKKKKKQMVTKTQSVLSLNTLNPMSLVLGPLQIVLKNVCMVVRTGNNLFTWKDPFVSFWTIAVLFIIWVVATLFPYAFFFFWFFRVLGVLLLGPQNAGVWWYLQKKKRSSKADKIKDENERFKVLETGCMVCKSHFGIFNGKHHCRSCGDAVCGECSKNKMKVQVSMFGSEKGMLTPSKKKRVCDLCFRGEKKIDAHKMKLAIDAAKEATDEDSNVLMDGLKGTWNVTKKVGMGVGRATVMGGELVGTGLVQVGEGVVDGTTMVGKGTGKLLKRTGKSIMHLVAGKYTIEVPIERSMNKKFVDRPCVYRSFAKKIQGGMEAKMSKKVVKEKEAKED